MQKAFDQAVDFGVEPGVQLKFLNEFIPGDVLVDRTPLFD
jgi:hypothetical protein